MKRFLFSATFVALGAAIALSACSPLEQNASIPSLATLGRGPARDMLFNDGWKFSQSDDPNSRHAAFDDARWRSLDLPHDWSIEGEFDGKWSSATGYLPTGIGWYRKTFTLPAAARGKKVTVRFDGVMNNSTIYCNGQQVGERPYGYSSFTVDLTPALNADGPNVIAVRVNHEHFADCRWYQGSGIYRNVFLNVLDKVHIDTYGTFVTTPVVTAASADIQVETVVRNDTAEAAEVTVVSTIRDARGQTVATMQQSAPVPAGGEKPFAGTGKVANPALWGPGNPVMYSVQTQVKRGNAVIDQSVTPFGIRTFRFDPNSGFSINGQNMKLKGVCLHHDAGALGAAVPIDVWERRLRILQEAGVNAIRTAHNPPAPEFLDLCDRMGFLVQDEAFDEWTGPKNKWVTGRNNGTPAKFGYFEHFEKWGEIDARDMVLRDRNHPSIIMWSIGNEIDYNNDPFPPGSMELVAPAQRLIKAVKSADTTRPVTAACAFPETNKFKHLLDIEGYNYMERLYAADHAANSSRVIYGSENGHGLAQWQAVAQNDFISAQFLWTGIDYLGEAGAFPIHGSGAGLLNLAGFPKNQYWFRKSLWSDEPMVHLSTTGLGGGRGGRGRGAAGGPGGTAASAPAGQTISCFTNCDSVELFHDGQSLGNKPHTAGEVLSWTVNFTGTLKAVGRKGNATTTVELKKAGVPAAVKARADVRALQADGTDVAHIEVDITDAAGTLVADAAVPLTATISGPARILGMENGDLRTTEPYSARTRSTAQGRMLIYVQSEKRPGQATLTLTAPNLPAATVTLPIR